MGLKIPKPKRNGFAAMFNSKIDELIFRPIGQHWTSACIKPTEWLPAYASRCLGCLGLHYYIHHMMCTRTSEPRRQQCLTAQQRDLQICCSFLAHLWGGKAPDLYNPNFTKFSRANSRKVILGARRSYSPSRCPWKSNSSQLTFQSQNIMQSNVEYIPRSHGLHLSTSDLKGLRYFWMKCLSSACVELACECPCS